MTITNYLRALILISVLGALSGCENEEVRQHHLYNLQNCIVQTYKVDEIVFDPTDKSIFGLLGFDKVENRQSAHDHRAADCMAHEEKTTIEYQLAKHDDYEKVCELNQKWSNGSCEQK